MHLFPIRPHPPGTPPGTLHRPAETGAPPPSIRLIDYSPHEVLELERPDLAEIGDRLRSASTSWLRINGLPDADWLRQFGDLIGLHPLVQEDILNGGQRPKLEPYEDQLFLVMNIPEIRDDSIEIEQLYLVWHKHYLVTFYSGSESTFEPLLKRVRKAGTRVRSQGLDYLAYSILDLAIDMGFPLLESLGLELESLEERLLDDPDPSILQEIHHMKRVLILLRRAIWPQRDVINELLRDEDGWLTEPVLPYLRDCYDHTVRIMDLVESYRDASASLHDLYLSNVSLRMNDIMRVLTVIATIFIPLTFIVGVYGMNFDRSVSRWNMPELGWPYGYPAVWVLMLGVAGLMLWFFRRRKWL